MRCELRRSSGRVDMRLIEPSVEMLPVPKDEVQALKNLELIGRVCYKSEDKITEDSYKKFYLQLKRNGHWSVLEHLTCFWKIHQPNVRIDPNTPLPMFDYNIQKFINNKYTQVRIYPTVTSRDVTAYITTNARAIHENFWEMKYFYYGHPSKYYQRYSFRIICSRATANELVRHRNFSFMQESTRYCNYSKDKFNNEITFIKPYWYLCFEKGYHENNRYVFYANNYHKYLSEAEKNYFSMIKNGFYPQEARDVLPLATKTEIIMTGFYNDWGDFLNKRCAELASTGKPHPDMNIIAEKIKGLLDKEVAKYGSLSELYS